jgi:competence protein ComGC
LSKEVKMGTGLKIALAVVSILLMISLIANIYFYSKQYGITSDSGLETQVADLQSQVNSLTTTHDNYVSTHSHSNSEYDTLQSDYNNYMANHHHTDSEYNALEASELVTRLGANDERPWLQTPYFHISGEVWNVGTNAAYNCKLHIIIYQGAVVAEDTYINLGTINGKTFTSVDSKIYYEGSELTNWEILPEWE